MVEDVCDICLGTCDAALLTDTVVDNDGVVEGVTDDHQDNRDEARVNRHTEDDIHEVDHRHIMEQGYQRHDTCGETADALETDSNIENHEDRSDRNRGQTLQEELQTHRSFDGGVLFILEIIVREGLFQSGGDAADDVGLNAVVAGELDGDRISLLIGSVVHDILGNGKGYLMFGSRVLDGALESLFVDLADIGIADNGTALELDIEGSAEDKVADNTNGDDAEGNAEEDFALTDKVQVFFHLPSPPNSHFLRRQFTPEILLSMTRESHTPMMKLEITPISRV